MLTDGNAERFSSTGSLTCAIRELDAEQDHDFGGGGGHACGNSDWIGRAIMHPDQRDKREGLSTALLCQCDVLCHVAKEYSSFVAAARQEWFGVGNKCDMRADGRRCSAASIIGGLAAFQSRHRTNGIIAAATPSALYISDLIQGH